VQFRAEFPVSTTSPRSAHTAQTGVSSGNARGEPDRLPLVLFGVGFVTSLLMIFVGWRAQSTVDKVPDPYGFLALAHNLLRGEGFAGAGSVLNRRGPLYPATIALVFLLTGEHPLAVQLVQALMLSGACALVFDIGRRLYNRRTGVIAGLLCAFHPALLRYVPDFHLETLLMFLTTLAVWRSVRFLEKPSWVNGGLFGVCVGLAALTKAVVLLYPAAFAAWWILRERAPGLRRDEAAPSEATATFAKRLASRWVAAASIFVAMGVVILPWTYRNYRSSGHLVLITTGVGDAYLRGLVFSQPDYALLRRPPYTDAENASNAQFTALCRAAGTEWGRDDVETDRILSREAKARLLADPGAFLRKFGVQLFTFWFQMTSRANSLVVGAAALALWALALPGSLRARKEGYLLWPLLVPIVYLNLFLAALLALGRYSIPVLPTLCVLAAFGIDTLLGLRGKRAAP
jgi:Dolichyl-phosphate-mannose-protein mannosyltransferase